MMSVRHAQCRMPMRIARRWCGRRTRTAFSPACLRPPTGVRIFLRSMASTSKSHASGRSRMSRWRERSGCNGGPAPGEAAANPVAAALLDTIARCGLPAAPLDALIDARARDLYDDPIVTLSELEAYGRATASTLFGMAARILDRGAAPDDVADPAGVAYALAGLLKAFPRHAARGQIYLPTETLERHGVAGAEVAAGTAGPGLRAALAEIAGQARERLAQAAGRWQSVSPGARPAFLPLAWVAPLLARIERNPDPFVPIDLPQWRRQWPLWRAARRGVF